MILSRKYINHEYFRGIPRLIKKQACPPIKNSELTLSPSALYLIHRLIKTDCYIFVTNMNNKMYYAG